MSSMQVLALTYNTYIITISGVVSHNYMQSSVCVDPTVHGVIIQLPLPVHLDKHLLLNRLSPSKDVDGLHLINRTKLLQYKPLLNNYADFNIPCTPKVSHISTLTIQMCIYLL